MKNLIGIDIGGTKVNMILMNEFGKVSKEIEFKSENKSKKIIINKIIEITEIISAGKKISGIGIGAPGILDRKTNKIIKLLNMKGWENTDLRGIIEKKFKVKTKIENDSNCLAIAEKKFGSGKNVRNLVCLTIGTGIGGGIIIQDKLYVGKGNAAELGHITVEPEGIKCTCGNYGCLEEYVSGRAIMRYAKQAGLKGKIPQEIEEKARNGNEKAKKIYKNLGRYLGIGIKDIINILDPELIILAGGISRAADLFFKETIKEVKKRTFFKPGEIKISKLVKNGGAIGAACLFLN